ncbi:hypothetical protein Tco_1569453, partial [Tanacetum coccineum]
MDDNRTMAQLLEAPTRFTRMLIVVPDNYRKQLLRSSMVPLNLVQNKQFYGHYKEYPSCPHRYFNMITSTMKFPNVPSTSVKLMLFPFSLEGAARIWLEKEPPRSIQTIGMILNMVRALILDKKNQTPAPASVKAIEQSCVTCGGGHSYQNCPATNDYRDNIQEYVSQAAAVNYNQGNASYRPQMVANQIRPPGFPPMQNHQNNQNRGINFNQNRGNNLNQNRGSNFNQGQVYQPQINQPPTFQAPPYQAPAPAHPTP